MSYRRQVKKYAASFAAAVSGYVERRRLLSQCQKVSSGPYTEDPVFGNVAGFTDSQGLLARESDSGSHIVHKAVYDSRLLPSSPVIPQVARIDDSSYPASPICQVVHETVPNSPPFQLVSSQSESEYSDHGQEESVATLTVVEQHTEPQSGPFVGPQNSVRNPHYRRMRVCLGRAFEKFYGARLLEGTGMPAPHQPSGVVSSPLRPQGISTQSSGSTGASPDRQHDSMPVHQQVWGNQVAQSLPDDLGSISVVHSTPGRHPSSSPARQGQLFSRQSVSPSISSIGVVSECGDLDQSLPDMVHPRRRSVRVSRKLQTSQVLYFPTTSSGMEGGCTQSEVEESVRLCLSSSFTSTHRSPQGSRRESGDDIDSSSVGQEGLVFSPPRSLNRLSAEASGSSQSVDSGLRPASASQSSRAAPSGLVNQRRSLLARGLSQEATATILAATSSATDKQYSNSWGHFTRWCEDKDIDPFTSTVQMILNYLSFCFEEGLSFNTVKTRVSAITSRHNTFGGVRSGKVSLSSHPDIRAFFKGAMRRFPPVLDRVPSWDLPTVLKVLMCSPFEPLETLDLRLLMFKTVFLIAVTSAKRLGEIHAFDISPQMSIITPERVVLRKNANFLPKNPSVRNIQESIEYTPFGVQTRHIEGSMRALCVCRTLSAYIRATRQIRQCDQLFVTYKKGDQGRPASKATIATWLKTTIIQAYSLADKTLDKGVRAHSCRKQSVSWASLHAISVADICRQACWQSSSTFAKHYKLDLPQSVSERHADSVLRAAFAE